MKHVVAALALCTLLIPAFGNSAASAVSQQAYPYPSPSGSPPSGPPHYTDPGMNFIPPDDYLQAPIPPRDDPTDFQDPTVVGAFYKNQGTDRERVITITMEGHSGVDVTAYEGPRENQLRQNADTMYIARKDRTQLSNGMPAYWIEMTIGSGFNQQQVYEYVWVDGVRGVTLAIAGRLGKLEEKEARAALANVTAVAFPLRRRSG